MNHFPASDALCALPHPYCPDSVPAGLFDRAMAEISRFHCQHTPGYEHWLNANGLDAQTWTALMTGHDCRRFFASFFKQQLLLSPTGEDALELTSSGTSGQKSRMRYDQRSLAGAQFMVERIFSHYGWTLTGHALQLPAAELRTARCDHAGNVVHRSVSLPFRPRQPRRLRLAQHRRRPSIRCVRRDHGPAIVRRRRSARAHFRFPGVSLADPATHAGHRRAGAEAARRFAGVFRRWLENPGQRRRFPKHSCMRASPGNWVLKPSRCRDGYGAVEHAVPYIECAQHHFHVPVYAKVYVRNPQIFPFSPMASKACWDSSRPIFRPVPAHAVVMSDLATLHPGASCGCGLEQRLV